mmetsp:Transcript_31889/g.54926  ORF Transcript_31889/g.54926 Transcript_31889/m.54926 type:complete len:141 (+) Transcript_31889:294-716(+)
MRRRSTDTWNRLSKRSTTLTTPRKHSLCAPRASLVKDSSRELCLNDSIEQGRKSAAFSRAYVSQNYIISKNLADHEIAMRRSFEAVSRSRKNQKTFYRGDRSYEVVVPAKDMYEHIARLAFRGNTETLRKYKKPLATLNS